MARAAAVERRAWAGGPEHAGRAAVLVAVATFALTVVWAGLALLQDDVRFVILAPGAKSAVELALGMAGLFAALVLALFPEEQARRRIGWVAAGFLVLGLGSLALGYVRPQFWSGGDLNAAMAESLVVRTVADALFVVGLLPRSPRRLSGRGVVLVLAGVVLLLLLIEARRAELPRLVAPVDLAGAARVDRAMLQGLTGWHWGLSLAALALPLAAAVGAALHYPGRALGGWLVVAMALRAGAQIHNLFWPTAFTTIFTTASVLRLLFTLVVVAGGVLELRRIAVERAAMLANQRELSRRLIELAVLKADFSAMVAHELHAPIAAIRLNADALATRELPRPLQDQALAAIQDDADLLSRLAADVQSAARMERDDFAVRLAAVPVERFLAEAASYAASLPQAGPLVAGPADPLRVLADSDRITQVLHNLLSNAVKYSPPGTPVELQVVRQGGAVRFAVRDYGYGINEGDLERVFTKFGRGRDLSGRAVPGVGLGLYLSRRIVRAHGSDITLESTPGKGSVFSFELEVAP